MNFALTTWLNFSVLMQIVFSSKFFDISDGTIRKLETEMDKLLADVIAKSVVDVIKHFWMKSRTETARIGLFKSIR